jgi:hypothetical protein
VVDLLVDSATVRLFELFRNAAGDAIHRRRSGAADRNAADAVVAFTARRA